MPEYVFRTRSVKEHIINKKVKKRNCLSWYGVAYLKAWRDWTRGRHYKELQALSDIVAHAQTTLYFLAKSSFTQKMLRSGSIFYFMA